MDYCSKIIKAIDDSHIDKDAGNVLNNQIVDIYNKAHQEDDLGLIDDNDIKEEYKIGHHILKFLQFYTDCKHMDNITLDKMGAILKDIQSLNPNDFFLIKGFNSTKNNHFFDLFYDFVVKLMDSYKKYSDFKMYKPDIVGVSVKVLIEETRTKVDTKKHFSKSGKDVYYGYFRKFIIRFNNIFNDYLRNLSLINKNNKINIRTIKRYNNPKLISNYCKYHCTSYLPSKKFKNIICNMFQNLKSYANSYDLYYTDNLIGTYFGLCTISDPIYRLLANYKNKKNNQVYTIPYSDMAVLIIILNLFADYIQQRAFKPNRIAGKAINKITGCKAYDDKIWDIFDKYSRENKNRLNNKKGSNKDAKKDKN